MFWTTLDLEYGQESADALTALLQERFADKMQEQKASGTENVTIMLYDFENEKIIEEKTVTLSFDYEPSDYDQHNTHWGV
jgi:hypothetical protein